MTELADKFDAAHVAEEMDLLKKDMIQELQQKYIGPNITHEMVMVSESSLHHKVY